VQADQAVDLNDGRSAQQGCIYIDNGAENTAKEYTAGQYKADIQSGANASRFQVSIFSTGDYTVNGIVANGDKSIVTIDNAKIHLGVTKESTSNPGTPLTVDGGATVYLNHST